MCGISFNAQAQGPWDISATAADHVTATLSGGTLTISGTGAMQDFTGTSAQPWYSVANSITSLVINQGVANIGTFAFCNCVNIAGTLTIPNSVSSIGYNAFNACFDLIIINLPYSVTSIGYDAFASCNNLTAINVEAGNSYFSSDNGVLFNNDKSTLLRYPCGKNGAYVIPNTVISIDDDAFANCSGLTSITIPNSVITIGIGAFSNCYGLTSVTIPNSVTSIGLVAFQYCGLTSISCLNSHPNNITLGNNVFRGIDVTTCVLYVPAGSETDYGNAPQWSDFNIIEAIIPPIATTLPATDITQTTATLNVYLTIGFEPLTEQGWYYKKSAENDTQWVQTPNGNITGLTPNTTYDFFAYASTDAYLLVSGDTLHFTTLNTDGVDVIEQSNLQLYPNPAKDKIYITAESPINRVEIFNMDGKILMQENNFAGKMNVSSLAKAVYLVKVYTAQGIETVKIIKN